MKSESDVLKKFADEIIQKISRKTIIALQKVTATLSGDDSGLKNAWDEICVQVQEDKSFFWDAYDDTAKSFIYAYIKELQDHEKLAIWFQTDRGSGWLDEEEEKDDEKYAIRFEKKLGSTWFDEDEDQREKKPPFCEDDIVEYIVNEFVYVKAGYWDNERIRRYLERGY